MSGRPNDAPFCKRTQQPTNPGSPRTESTYDGDPPGRRGLRADRPDEVKPGCKLSGPDRDCHGLGGRDRSVVEDPDLPAEHVEQAYPYGLRGLYA